MTGIEDLLPLPPPPTMTPRSTLSWTTMAGGACKGPKGRDDDDDDDDDRPSPPGRHIGTA